MTLDEWSDDEIDSMIEIGGNSAANAIYEAFLPEGVSKPQPEASHDERMRFIRLEKIILWNYVGRSVLELLILSKLQPTILPIISAFMVFLFIIASVVWSV